MTEVVGYDAILIFPLNTDDIMLVQQNKMSVLLQDGVGLCSIPAPFFQLVVTVYSVYSFGW